ncbi:hypothetical protein FAGKG844_160028 [Frankia sp. AgKG'84/4]
MGGGVRCSACRDAGSRPFLVPPAIQFSHPGQNNQQSRHGQSIPASPRTSRTVGIGSVCAGEVSVPPGGRPESTAPGVLLRVWLPWG